MVSLLFLPHTPAFAVFLLSFSLQHLSLLHTTQIEEMEKMGDEQKKQHHIVMLPFMAQGHIIPFLDLANKIHQRFGFKITIATTPLNLQYLNHAISKNNSNTQNIHLSMLPFNSCDHDLPPNTENTESLPLHKVINLFHASASLESSFRELVSNISIQDGNPPLCLVSDVFMGWVNQVAESFDTVNVAFSTGGAYGTAAYMSLWQHLPHRSSKSEEFKLPGFPDSCTFHITQLHQFLRDADGTDNWSRFFQPQIAYSLKSFGILCNSVEEIEPLGLDVLKKYAKLPVWCIGPLLPPKMLLNRKDNEFGLIGQRSGRQPGVSPEQCLEWLERNSESSVLYISFGSQNTISEFQMMSLAMGLKDSERPFIWVIRPPIGFDLKTEFKNEWLPRGFVERVTSNKRGLLVHGWAPQLEILCHKSTGAFLSHCGWNSIMESLSQGVPIIGWPLAAEQGYNSKMLMEDMGVSVELTRGTKGSISKEQVKKMIETVMGNEGKAKEMKEKAVEIGRLIRAAVVEDGSYKGSSHKAMDEFVSALIYSTNRTT